MGFLQNIKGRLETIEELFRFFWKLKMWWIIPFIAALLLVGLLFTFAQSSPIAPFLYTVF